MKRILSEKNCVALLFVMVLITFSLAQQHTHKIEEKYLHQNPSVTASHEDQEIEAKVPDEVITPAVPLR